MSCNRFVDTAVGGFIAGTQAFQDAVARRRAALREELAGIFPVGLPVVLEVGAGHGHFLASYAAAHPDHFCVGVDLMTDRVRRATKKRDRAGLKNLVFMRAEAMEFLDCLPAGVLFQKVFVLFPDPWPKKRHHKNRVLSPSFFDTLGDRCVGGAEVFFRTDFEQYFEEVRGTLTAHALWELREIPVWPFEETTVFQERAEVFYSLGAERMG